MTLQQIQCFITVAKVGSINAAAEELFYTQSTVSYQLRSLEKELGFSLFSRSASGVALTAAGRILLKDAEIGYAQILSGISSARNVVSGLQNITLALCCPISMAEIGALIESLKKQFLYHQIKLKTCEEMTPLTLLSSKDTDIAFVYKSDVKDRSDYCYRELFRSPSFLIVSKSHPLANRESISLQEAAQEVHPVLESTKDFPHYMSYLSSIRKINPELKLRMCRFSGTHEVRKMVASGAIISHCNSYHANIVRASPDLAAVRIRDFPEYSMGIAYRSDSKKSIDAFVEYIVSNSPWKNT